MFLIIGASGEPVAIALQKS